MNVDRILLSGVDVRCDASQGLPFLSESFGFVLCEDVLEHLELEAAMREIWRVLRPGGQLLLRVPHFSSRNVYVDPTHNKAFSMDTFDFFCQRSTPTDGDYYFDFGFSHVVSRFISFRKREFLWDYVCEAVVNRRRSLQLAYEMTFGCRLFPAENVVVLLEK